MPCRTSFRVPHFDPIVRLHRLRAIALGFVRQVVCVCELLFFFSSRRRHTRCLSDWSSDVCSSDLSNNTRELVKTCERYCARVHHVQTDADVRPEWFKAANVVGLTAGTSTPDDVIRSEERRVGKEWRSREVPYHQKRAREERERTER